MDEHAAGERSPDCPVVLVTGGASGIGLAVARRFARDGAAVALVDVNQDRLDEAVAALQAIAPGAPRFLGMRLDVRSEADMAAMAERTLAAWGRIDCLVASAGVLRAPGTPPKPLLQTSPEEWDYVLDVNLRGMFLSNRAVLPAMTAQRRGNIVNLSSLSGRQGRANDAPYCASKFGVIGLSEALAEEVRGYGVRVQVVLPGVVGTPLWEQNGPFPAPDVALAPEQVADFIAYLVSLPPDTMIAAPVLLPVKVRRRRGATRSEPPGTPAEDGPSTQPA
jgi:NAD(P)-dependent dehydrogenase (short-subunit alcohol dehydrogenase family)